jgi:heavy metal translocating P-type ATPase
MNVGATTAGACDYCGLPLPQPLFSRRRVVAEEGPAYCCSGCRFAAAITQERGEAGAIGWTMTSLALATFFSMSVMVFTIALWEFDVYREEAGTSSRMAVAFGDVLRWLCLVFSLPVLLLLGRPLAANAVRNLRGGVLSTDLLLLTGVVAAFVVSTWSVVGDGGPVYFETGCMILVAVTLGRWFEATGKHKATEALDSLQKLLPETVTRLEGGLSSAVPLNDVRVGEVLVVRAGERVPVDGTIVWGRSALDSQVFTGESIPHEAVPGDSVLAGTLSLDGTIHLRAGARAREGAFGRLLAAVRAARESRGRFQCLADRISTAFLPVILGIAVAAFAWHGIASGWGEGLLVGLSVVLVACPCALGLATPLAVWAALGRAAQRQVLFRSGEALERLAEVQAVAFDKTGTLTTGSPQVVGILLEDSITSAEVARRVAPLASASVHLFSRAILSRLQEEEGLGLLAPAEPVRGADEDAAVLTVPGCGVMAGPDTPDATRLGSLAWLHRSGLVLSDPLSSELKRERENGRSLVAAGWEGAVRAVFVLDEQLRPEARNALQRLRSAGREVAVLTGDHVDRGARLSSELSVPVQAALLPEEKAKHVRRLRDAFGPVAMVGDGINDAPALSAADVGIAMGCGTDVTRDSGDVCLLGNDLAAIPWAIDLAGDAVRTIRGNLWWAFGYNAVGVVAAAAGWLHPSLAAALMLVSSVVVLSRSLRLGRESAATPRDLAASPKGEAALPVTASQIYQEILT